MRARRTLAFAGAAALSALLMAQGADAGDRTARDYVVVYKQGAGTQEARQAVARAGGRIVKENAAIGVATVRSTDARFAGKAVQQAALSGAASNRTIGTAPKDVRARFQDVERMQAMRDAAKRRGAKPQRAQSPSTGDPLSGYQWDMQMIGATIDGSYRHQQGAHDVRVGVIDTGIDGSHPDIAPNFDRALSRNFTVDDPVIDGPCEDEADRSCQDASDVDEDGHGTHVAGTIGAPLNGVGIAGVAPRVDLVNLRAGQDSGYFFLQPTVDALTYAADHGVDVVNMSFYIDPWLYNCAGNPADPPEAQAQQRVIIEATQRALTYARSSGVSLIAAEGNGNSDLGRPEFDNTSPDYPPDAAYDRTIDNSCVSMPTEAAGVIGVTSVGPSRRKAYYSDYGTEQADVAAPGGDVRDFFGTPQYGQPSNTVLAPYPEALARAAGEINPDGTPNTPFVLMDAKNGRTSYYQYLQGTSMAAPHAVGVAALAVAEYGRPDRVHGGVTLAPDQVERRLLRSATDTACPTPRLFDYPDPDLGPEYNAYCEGSPKRNGFFGDGIVSATGIIGATSTKAR